MPTTAQRQEITRFAEEYYDENRDALVASLAEQIEHSIAIGEAQLKSGEHMDLATFKERLYAALSR